MPKSRSRLRTRHTRSRLRRYPAGRAARRPPGEGRLRLLFDEPQAIRRVLLVFDEHERARTQELALLWSPLGGSALREIVRQQYNFSPLTTTREVEDYAVNLSGMGVLELRIKPHVGGGETVASLTRLRLAQGGYCAASGAS